MKVGLDSKRIKKISIVYGWGYRLMSITKEFKYLNWDRVEKAGKELKRLCERIKGDFKESVDKKKQKARFVCYLEEPLPIKVITTGFNDFEEGESISRVLIAIDQTGTGDFPTQYTKYAGISYLDSNLKIFAKNPDWVEEFIDKNKPEREILIKKGKKIEFYHNPEPEVVISGWYFE